jgi:hypothetical protein
MSRDDLARQRLKEVRTLQGWREAYRIAGLTDEGSDATKRRRLSRLINRETSGAKTLSAAQRKKVNRAYRYRQKTGKLLDRRVEREVKLLNRYNAEARKQARRTFGAGGLTPDARKLERRLRKYQPLSDEEIERIREGFRSAEEDSGRAIRKEYRDLMRKVEITSLPPRQRKDFNRRLRKAERAVERDEAQQTLEV